MRLWKAKRELTDAQGAHSSLLSVQLVDISNAVGQERHRDVITVLVLELSGLITSSIDVGASISFLSMLGQERRGGEDLDTH